MKLFNNVLRGFNRYMTHLSRARVRELLLKSSDRMLADAGFSRELLESGVKAWPWHSPAPELAPLRFRQLGKVSADTDPHADAVHELQSISDKELSDLGISRGSIRQAVMYGRDDIENNRERKVA